MSRLRWYLASLFLVGTAHLLYLFHYTMDDAYISFRYAQNLARGLGLVYNPGQFTKGFSNSLWTLLMTGPELLGYDPLIFSKLVGFLSFAVVFALLARFANQAHSQGPASPSEPLKTSAKTVEMPVARKKRKRRTANARRESRPTVDAATNDARHSENQMLMTMWSVLPVLFLSLSAPVAVWFMAGMESGFYTALVVAAVLRRLNEQSNRMKFPYSALLFAAVIWTRPEGIVFFAAMAFHDVAFRIIKRRFRTRDALWLIVPLAAYLGELAISNWYYGDPFPNTYYAKVPGPRDGSSPFALSAGFVLREFTHRGYIGSRLWEFGGYGVIALGALSVIQRPRFRHNSALLLAIAAQFAVICRTFGDWMPAGRFLVPVLPFMFLLLVDGMYLISTVIPRSQRRWLSAVFVVIVVGLFVPGNFKTSRYVRQRQPVNATDKLVEGRYFASLVEPGRSMSTYDIGGIGYASRLHVIDTAGLTDRFLAKWRWSGVPDLVRYLWLNQPDIIKRHPGEKMEPDESLYRFARRSGRYLAFADEKVLVRRGMVLLPELPSGARSLDQNGQDDTPTSPYVRGIRLPAEVLNGGHVHGILYWYNPTDTADHLPTRSLLLRDGRGGEYGIESKSLGEYLPQEMVWPGGTYFADVFEFDAPTIAAAYELEVHTDGAATAQTVAMMEVVDQAQASNRARALMDDASILHRAGNLLPALSLARDAARLNIEAARDLYTALVVKYANELYERARSASTFPAMGDYSEARFVLMRAIDDLGCAPSDLRRAVDRIEQERARLIEQEWALPDNSSEFQNPFLNTGS